MVEAARGLYCYYVFFNAWHCSAGQTWAGVLSRCFLALQTPAKQKRRGVLLVHSEKLRWGEEVRTEAPLQTVLKWDCIHFTTQYFHTIMKAKIKLMLDVLEELSTSDLQKLQSILNTREINGKNIPKSKLENMDRVNTAYVIINYHGDDCVKVLQEALEYIPRKDLIEIFFKKTDGKDENESQTDETDGIPAKKRKLQDLNGYNGKFSLADMEDYALRNQDQFISQLEEELEPAAFERLRKQLAASTPKNSFSITAQHFYSLRYCRDISTFLNNISSGKKSQMVPKKILDLLFPAKEINKREAHKKRKGAQGAQRKSAQSYMDESDYLFQELNECENDNNSVLESGTQAGLVIPSRHSDQFELEDTNDTNECENDNNSVLESGTQAGLVIPSRHSDQFKLEDTNDTNERKNDNNSVRESGTQAGFVIPSRHSDQLEQEDTNDMNECKNDNNSILESGTQAGLVIPSSRSDQFEQEDTNDTNECKNDNNSVRESGTKARLVIPSSRSDSAGELDTDNEMGKKLANEGKMDVQASPEDMFNKPLEDNKLKETKDMIEHNKDVMRNGSGEKTDEVPNTTPENEMYKNYKAVFGILKKKYQKDGWNLSPDSQLCINPVQVCEHKRYSCLKAQDVLLFKLPKETEYHILRILKNKKELTRNNDPKKHVKFELQFNMAILGIRRSELIGCGDFFTIDASLFKEHEEFFEKIVSEVVLPVLALYKRVRQDRIQKAWLDILLPGVEQQPEPFKAN